MDDVKLIPCLQYADLARRDQTATPRTASNGALSYSWVRYDAEQTRTNAPLATTGIRQPKTDLLCDDCLKVQRPHCSYLARDFGDDILPLYEEAAQDPAPPYHDSGSCVSRTRWTEHDVKQQHLPSCDDPPPYHSVFDPIVTPSPRPTWNIEGHLREHTKKKKKAAPAKANAWDSDHEKNEEGGGNANGGDAGGGDDNGADGGGAAGGAGAGGGGDEGGEGGGGGEDDEWAFGGNSKKKKKAKKAAQQKAQDDEDEKRKEEEAAAAITSTWTDEMDDPAGTGGGGGFDAPGGANGVVDADPTDEWGTVATGKKAKKKNKKVCDYRMSASIHLASCTVPWQI